MDTTTPQLHPEPASPGTFSTTRWTVVLEAGSNRSAGAAEALEQLCRSYWYPLYAYVRRRGTGPEDARDLTQAFFARLLDRNTLAAADPNRGRFRSFLLKSMQNFLINEWQKSVTEAGGVNGGFVAWDGNNPEHLYAAEPDATVEPETLFDKRWATTVLDGALGRLRDECRQAGKEQSFVVLKDFVWGDTPSRTYADLAAELGVAEGNVAVMVHRLRARFREILRAEIAQTVATPADIDDELRHLARVMSH